MLYILVNQNDYNIPSNNRELQPATGRSSQGAIITYQVITGNYSFSWWGNSFILIITYQVITGNYSKVPPVCGRLQIITYQVITGNYSLLPLSPLHSLIITYQVITGNYSLKKGDFSLPLL